MPTEPTTPIRPAASDLDLLRDYQRSGDAEAFAELVRRHARLAYAAARRVTGNGHDAEDVTQTCFLELARKAETVKASVAGWLHTAATRRAINTVDREAVRRRHEQASAQAGADDPGPDDWSALETRIDEAIAALPDKLREPIILHFLEGRTQAELARALDVNQSTVSRRLQTGVDQLRNDLQRRGVAVPAVALAAALTEHGLGASVPASVTAALGKLALVGGAAAAAPTGAALSLAAAAPWVIGVFLVALITGALLVMTPNNPTPPTPPAAQTAGGALSHATVRREGNRVWIEGLPQIGFGVTSETSYAGALAAATSVTRFPIDAVDIMGHTALAFRTRLIRATDQPGWSPAGPVGEFPEETRMADRASGWTTQWSVQFNRGTDHTDLSHHRDQITASIDAGLPVLAYGHSLDMAVIYGYETDSNTVLIREYSADLPEQLDLTQTKGLIAFLTDRQDPPPPRDLLLHALRQAVRNGQRPPEPDRNPFHGGAWLMHYGADAYDRWIDSLRAYDRLDDAQRRKLFSISWWTFDVLTDARRWHAGAYLRRHASLLDAEGAAALERAAAHYDEAGALLDDALQTGRVFHGPWAQGKGFDDWTDAVRADEIALLEQVRNLDERAVEELRQALPENRLDPEVVKAFAQAIYRDRGDLDAVRELVDQYPALVHARPWAPNWDGTGLGAAAGMCVWHRPKMHQIAALLVERGAACDLPTAARAGLVDEVRRWLDAAPEKINQTDEQGRTPLYRAACVYGEFREGEDVADLLIERGATVDLFTASTLGMVDRVRELLEEDPANARTVDGDGMTALHWVARPRRGWADRHDVAEQNFVEIARLLIEAGADVEAVNPQEEGMRPLHHCGEWMAPTTITELLLQHGADVNAKAGNGWTPLDYAIDRGRDEAVAYLRSRGGVESGRR